jgi:hypothetical protein
MKESNWNKIASELGFHVKNYQGITKQIVQVSNRCHACGIDPEKEELIHGQLNRYGKRKTQGLEHLKNAEARKIGRALTSFTLWADWLDNVPGIGHYIGGELINLYYFKSIPVCNDCGTDLEDFECPRCEKKSKGQGLIKYRIELRDFPTISSWWHFMGRHVVNGKVPKRRKQREDEDVNPNDWSNRGRVIGYQIKESFNKSPLTHKYKAYAEERKRYREGTHPDATKMHRHNMAWNEAVKLFLSHFWQVAHILEGAEMTQPYIIKHGGHDPESIIPPYYFNGNV